MSFKISKLTGKLYNDEFLEIPFDTNNEFYLEFENWINEGNQVIYFDGTPEEIAEYEYNLKPKTISRMKFIIQVFLTTGIMYEDIVLFIQNLTFDEAQKYVILTRLRSATHFDRYSNDLLTIAQMMGITSEQLDEIFINGNLLN